MKENRVIQRVPFGYVLQPKGKVVVDTEKAKVVRALFRDIHTTSIRKLAALHGFDAPSHVHDILTEPAYWTGKLRRRNEPTFDIPTIVPVPQWGTKDKKPNASGRYLLSTVIGRVNRWG